jgi:hypothetical protein
MSQQDRDEAQFVAQVHADAAYARPPWKADERTLEPEWSAPGPSVYKTLMDEAHRDNLDELAVLLTDLIAPAAQKEAMSRLYGAMSRLYVRGVAEGYSQAARAFDKENFPHCEDCRQVSVPIHTLCEGCAIDYAIDGETEAGP